MSIFTLHLCSEPKYNNVCFALKFRVVSLLRMSELSLIDTGSQYYRSFSPLRSLVSSNETHKCRVSLS